MECDRVGPYIGAVTIFVHTEMESDLVDLMRVVSGRRNLERLVIGDDTTARDRGFSFVCDKHLCRHWGWLSIVVSSLQSAYLPCLQEVQLVFQLKGYSRLEREWRDDGIHEQFINVPPLPPSGLSDFILALPPSVTKLQLGKLDTSYRYTSALSSESFIRFMTTLRAGSLPQLCELLAPSCLELGALDYLVSALREAAFASTIEVLLLAPSLGSVHSGRSMSFDYKGCLDLTPLISALHCCPRLKSITLGRGKCEARHFFDFMDLVVSGQLQHFDHVPLPTDLPITFATSEEMDHAIGLIAQALGLGRFTNTKLLVLGDDPMHQPISEAALRSFLTDTMDCPLPQLEGLAIKGHFELPTLQLLRDWLERRGDLKSLIIKCAGRPLLSGGEGEQVLLDIFRRNYDMPKLWDLEICWGMEVAGLADKGGPGEVSAGDMWRTGHVTHARTSVLNTLQDVVKASRRYEFPVIEFGQTVTRPESCGAFLVTTKPAETVRGDVGSVRGPFSMQIVLGSGDHSFFELLRFGRSFSEEAPTYFKRVLSHSRDTLLGTHSDEVMIHGDRLTLQAAGTVKVETSQLSIDFEAP
jgi:hypothetical protein